MTAIWNNDGSGWKLLAPSGFVDEAALHTLVEGAPHLLPLAGSPSLAVIGREVQLGNGYADLLAVEPSGRLVVIEVKLARNSEARRAVLAQILSYAAYLAGTESEDLERELIARYLRERGYESLADASAASDQSGAFDIESFRAGLAESLSQGRFRLVLVLDSAPDELSRLVAYLESVTDKLLIDLITVSAFDVNGTRLIVPQRVEPERRVAPVATAMPSASKSEGHFSEGAEGFLESIEQVSAEHRAALRRLADWALGLEREGLIATGTYRGKSGRVTLLPRLTDTGVGLVTIWNDRGTASISLWRSVFLKRAPNSIERVEAVIAPRSIGNGNVVRDPSDDLLDALADAYREANG